MFQLYDWLSFESTTSDADAAAEWPLELAKLSIANYSEL